MNFRPELAALVMAGEKTVTRRLTSPNPRSPWFAGSCSLRVGKDYAVCPGRGKNAIGRVVVRDVTKQRLGALSREEARREGFASPMDFHRAFAAINPNRYDPDELVWRVEFEVAR